MSNTITREPRKFTINSAGAAGRKISLAASPRLITVQSCPESKISLDKPAKTISLAPLDEIALTLHKHIKKITIAHKGAQGIPGTPGDITAVINTFAAGENLGGQRLVYSSGGSIFHADHTLNIYGQIVGITKTSALSAAPVQVISEGYFSDPSFSFTPDANLFLGVSGVISETPPASGIYQHIGHALSTTEIFIELNQPIQL